MIIEIFRELFLPLIFFVVLNIIVVISTNKAFGVCLPFVFICCAMIC